MSEANGRTALYRIRGEADVLLYIGISNHLSMRWNHHQAHQPWWDELRSLTVEWYDWRSEAEDAEKAAILAEQPKYNKTYLKRRRKSTPKRLEFTPVESGVAVIDPRPDDEDLLVWVEAANMVRLSPDEFRQALIQTAGPQGFTLGRSTLFRRRDIRQWIADVEASQPRLDPLLLAAETSLFDLEHDAAVTA
jgi:predicted GIY-YIG superfamily endonuclease